MERPRRGGTGTAARALGARRRAAVLSACALACALALGAALLASARNGGPAPVERAESATARTEAGAAAPAGRRAVVVGPERRLHILSGDARGGGHRPGRGIPGKSEFPSGWSDDRIIGAIEDVANDPGSARRVEADGRAVLTGHRAGVEIRVVVERDGRSVVTGYPTNTPRNPPR